MLSHLVTIHHEGDKQQSLHPKMTVQADVKKMTKMALQGEKDDQNGTLKGKYERARTMK